MDSDIKKLVYSDTPTLEAMHKLNVSGILRFEKRCKNESDNWDAVAYKCGEVYFLFTHGIWSDATIQVSSKDFIAEFVYHSAEYIRG